MESTQAEMKYVVHTVVKRVERHFVKTHLRGAGDKAEFIDTDRGWFVLFDGSWEAIHMGFEEPMFKRGDAVKITFERKPDAIPSQPPV